MGDPCTQAQGNPAGDCQAGLICLGVTEQGEARCFQDCTSNDGLCAANSDGRTACETVTESGIKVCLNTNAAKDADCGFLNKSQARCRASQTPPLYCSPTTQKCTEAVVQNSVGDPCNRENDNSEPLKLCNGSATPPLACDPSSGVCVEQTIVGTLEKCGGIKGCAADDVCVGFQDGTGGTVSYCLKGCTPGAGASCPGNAECLTLNSGGGACRWAGALQQNDACEELDTTKDKIDTTNLCAGGLQCLGLNGTKPICIQIWEGTCQTPGKTCNQGDKCVPLQSTSGTTFGGCFSDCSGGKACPGDLECSAGLGDACLGETPVGPVAQGGVCSTDPSRVTTEGCQKDLFCLGLENAPRGICSRDCASSAAVCSSTTPPMECIEINPQTGSRACVFSCSQPGQTCPTGTTCNSQFGICLP